MRGFLLLLVLILLSCSPLWAQKANLFSVRAGYLESSTIVDITNTLLIGLAPLKTKPGFYVGFAYEHPLSTWFTSQIELNFQQKGHQFRGFPKEADMRSRYNYIGVTPMIGIKLIQKLCFLIGPELNLLISKSATWPDSKHAELGLVGRGRYQINRVGITGGYFRGLTVFDRSPTHTYSFTNQNWQVGLVYQVSKR